MTPFVLIMDLGAWSAACRVHKLGFAVIMRLDPRHAVLLAVACATAAVPPEADVFLRDLESKLSRSFSPDSGAALREPDLKFMINGGGGGR